MKEDPVVLVTGGARRVGSEIIRHFHAAGYRVVVHFNSSQIDAEALVSSLNEQRRNSAVCFAANLTSSQDREALVGQCVAAFSRLDVLVNSASSFYATPLRNVSESDWDNLIGTNLKAPLFLTRALAPTLKEYRGAIINLVDIHARSPLRDFNLYGAAKAGLVMLTRSLALELSPEIRVNAIAPGVVMWPEGMSDSSKQRTTDRIPLGDIGSPADVARTALFLADQAPFITGEVITVDGGQSLT